MAEDFCRLCLRPVDKANCAEIKKDEAKQEMFSEFFPELNIDLSANPTLCNECALNLEVSSNFKQGVLENEARIESELAKSKSKAKKKKIDLKTLLDAETKNELKSDLSICRTCLAICKDPSIRLYEAKTNVMPYSFVKKMCVQIFELEFTNSDKPVMCDECWETLQNAYDFRKNCLKTEKKITSYCQENKLTILGEIDLKKLNSLPANEDDSEMSDDDDFGDVDIKEEIFDPNDPDLSNPGSSSSSLQHVKLKKEEDGASGSVSVKSESGMDDEDEDMGDHPDLVDPNNLKSEEDGEGDDIDTKMEVGDTVKVDPEAAGAAGPSGNSNRKITTTASQKFKCAECQKEASSTEYILQSYQAYSQRFHCTECSFSTNTLFSFFKHTEQEHVTPTYRCITCSYETNAKQDFLAHHFIHSKLKYLCADCRKAANKEIELNKRIETTQIFRCTECAFQANQSFRLEVHKLIHATPRFHCTDCSYRTPVKSWLVAHKLIHAARVITRIFRCTECTFETIQKGTFERHKLMHAPPSFHCTQCPFQTARKYSLTKHKLLHAARGETPVIRCTDCSIEFKRKASLIAHNLRVHAAPDPKFSCTGCSYETRMKKLFLAHKLKHKGTTPVFRCSKCSFQTRQIYILKKHKLIHAAPKFSCTECSFKTVRKESYDKHKLRHAAPVPKFS